jgi:hypothetical protein
MHAESPFREDDLQARVDALRAERDDLARRLATVRRLVNAAGERHWSWGRFLFGLFVGCAAVLLPLRWIGSQLEAEGARYQQFRSVDR